MTRRLIRSGFAFFDVFKLLGAIAAAFALPFLLGDMLVDNGLVINKTSAAIVLFIAIVSSALVLLVVDVIQTKWQLQGLTPRGKWGYLAITLFAIGYSCYGFLAFNLIRKPANPPNAIQLEQPLRKPSNVHLRATESASKLDIPLLSPYRVTYQLFEINTT